MAAEKPGTTKILCNVQYQRPCRCHSRTKILSVCPRRDLCPVTHTSGLSMELVTNELIASKSVAAGVLKNAHVHNLDTRLRRQLLSRLIFPRVECAVTSIFGGSPVPPGRDIDYFRLRTHLRQNRGPSSRRIEVSYRVERFISKRGKVLRAFANQPAKRRARKRPWSTNTLSASPA